MNTMQIHHIYNTNTMQMHNKYNTNTMDGSARGHRDQGDPYLNVFILHIQIQCIYTQTQYKKNALQTQRKYKYN